MPNYFKIFKLRLVLLNECLKKGGPIITCILYVAFCLTILFPQVCLSATINVPAEYSTIRDAVDAASDGDLVLVIDGVYDEQQGVRISKSITLRSLNGPRKTLINGGVAIAADSVVIEGFSLEYIVSDIPLSPYKHLVIRNNHLGWCHFSNTNHSLIIGNTFANNSNFPNSAIGLEFSNNNRIIGNNIGDYGGGIELRFSSDNRVVQNSIISKNAWGVRLDFADDNYVANNSFVGGLRCGDNGVANTVENNLYDWNLLKNGLCPTMPLNVAIYKPVVMSSSAFSTTGTEAVDGNTGGDLSLGEVTCTEPDLEPFWQVDLLGNYNISKITLWNRQDCCPERLRNFYIETSTDGNSWGEVHYQETAVGEFIEFPLNSVTARYVRVRLDHQDFLSLAEVQVFGSKL